jgi:hypothetical protein
MTFAGSLVMCPSVAARLDMLAPSESVCIEYTPGTSLPLLSPGYQMDAGGDSLHKKASRVAPARRRTSLSLGMILAENRCPLFRDHA